MIYLDFAKAFDCVPHTDTETLLKLWGIGISYQWSLVMVQVFSLQKTPVCLYKWLYNSDYLATMSCQGYPCRGASWSLLYSIAIVYTNDLSASVQSSFMLSFADTKCYQTIAQQLQQDLEFLAKWSEDWTLNLNKFILTQHMHLIISTLFPIICKATHINIVHVTLE